MFGIDFYPSPPEVLDELLMGEEVKDKICWEPEAGKGDVVDRLYSLGALDIVACEIDPDLRRILNSKRRCTIIANDTLTVTSDMVSHVDLVVMNPPFSKADQHITHVYNVVPDGCRIIALCNAQTIKNPYSKTRQELKNIVDQYGSSQTIDNAFLKAERITDVEITVLRIQKPGGSYEQEFSGFFMEDQGEEETGPGLMSYNVVRDLVNRYVESIKIYDQQLETAVRLGEMMSDYLDAGDDDNDKRSIISVTVTRDGVAVSRNEFKKRMQKSGWKFIFGKMNMKKYATKGLKEDINKFVEKQTEVPFTMANIYHMLRMVVGTHDSRMDKAILEVFDAVTRHSDDNHYQMEGWKTNSHYVLNKRFIVPSMISVGWGGKIDSPYYGRHYFEMIEDLVKALCYLTGENYSDKISLEDFIDYPFLLVKDGKYMNDPGYDFDVKIKEKDLDRISRRQQSIYESEIQHNELEFGKWFDWGYFKCRAYKKGTMHFEFKDEAIWGLFNQRVAKLKGYPLPEKKEQTKYQKRQAGTDKMASGYAKKTKENVIL